MTPMKLSPVFKDYLWGGQRLKTEYHKQTDITPLAESWELSCHKDGTSVISSGANAGTTLAEYLAQHPEAVGAHGKDFTYFPILFKLIDAKDALSLQVHPNDEYALLNEGEYGKTEMWVVLEAEPDAKLVFGFQESITKQQMRDKIADNTLLDVVNFVPVHKGDVFFIQAGTLHAIGAGIVIAEIQQNSNTTYRVYDYNRVGADGKTRPLHEEKAVAVTDTSALRGKAQQHKVKLKNESCEVVELADCAYFRTDRVTLDGVYVMEVGNESFAGIFCAQGSVVLRGGDGEVTLQKGDTAFVPAGIGACTITGKAELLTMGV